MIEGEPASAVKEHAGRSRSVSQKPDASKGDRIWIAEPDGGRNVDDAAVEVSACFQRDALERDASDIWSEQDAAGVRAGWCEGQRFTCGSGLSVRVNYEGRGRLRDRLWIRTLRHAGNC